MTKERNALKSGIFIIVSVALMIGVVIGIKGLANFSQPTDLRAVSFRLADDVGGLQVGDDVRIGGFKVGTIQEIEVVGADAAQKDAAADAAAADPTRIRVTFTFPRKYALHRDAVLRIQGTLTGTSWLNFEDLGRAERLPANEEIVGRPSTMGETLAMVGKLGPMIDDVRLKTLPAVNDTIARVGRTADAYTQAGEHASGLVKDLRGELGPITRKYHQVTDVAVEMMAKVRDLFGDTTPDFRTTMANLRDATGSINRRLPPMLERVDTILAKLDTTMASANAALEDVKTTAANAKELTGAAKGVLVGNRGKLDSMIASLKTTGDNLKQATAEIRRSPWRLLYKPAPGEMANLNLYDAAREFADGANELNDAALALRDALQQQPQQVDAAEVKKLMERVSHSFDSFHEVERKLWDKVKE